MKHVRMLLVYSYVHSVKKNKISDENEKIFLKNEFRLPLWLVSTNSSDIYLSNLAKKISVSVH